MFEIPPAPRSIPISWNGHYYGRKGESLTSLGQEKIDEIRNQTIGIDWSGQVVETATIADLDDEALEKSRESYALKSGIPEAEIENWSDEEFLTKLRIIRNGKLTRAAILLLGKPQSIHLLDPHPVEITWKLDAGEQDYQHFSIPFLLATTKVYNKIRNTQLSILPDNQLVPVKVWKYDQRIVLEAMHNCIAHQDYSENSKIVITEEMDKLTLENAGDFFEGKPENYILDKLTPLKYRNTLLVDAMHSLNMIDKVGYGINMMHKVQAERYLPMPDYELSENRVNLTIHGNFVDLAYSKLLIQKTDIPFEDILALDRVQKKLRLSDKAIKSLRSKKLIEGRKPNFRVSAGVADATERRAEYIREKGLEESSSTALIRDYLEKFGEATRKDIDAVLRDAFGTDLTAEERKKKITYLLFKLRRKGVITNTGSRTKPAWRLERKE